EDGIRDFHVTGVQTCALPIYRLVNSLLYCTGTRFRFSDGRRAALNERYCQEFAIYKFFSRNDCRELSLAIDRKSTRLNYSHVNISYAVFCLKKKKGSLDLRLE